MRVVVALLAAALLAGCQASPTLERLRGETSVPEPIFLEHVARVGADHDERYEVEVGERAALLNVTVSLAPRGASAAGAAPARLDVEILSPSGVALRNATLDAARPTLAFTTDQFAERGTYAVRVRGVGLSQPLGQDVGAVYVVTLEVLHG